MLKDVTPAVYFPIDRGLYEIGPGLKPLGHDFGNGDADARIFQFDREFGRFRNEKLTARKEDLSKYFGTERLNAATQQSIVRFIINTLSTEHPKLFTLSQNSQQTTLTCHLTGETLSFSDDFELVGVKGQESMPSYSNAFDALISQTQEDAAVVSLDENNDWLSAIHVCSPSHWDPRQKLGRSFLDVHAPVPGFERVARAHKQILEAMIYKGPFVRFVWSFVTDTRLNHHPEPPPGSDIVAWRGRSFQKDPAGKSPFYLRVERQLTYGFPQENAALFLIRLSFIEGNVIKKHGPWRSQLISALRSMSPESRQYKGVASSFDELLKWLEC